MTRAAWMLTDEEFGRVRRELERARAIPLREFLDLVATAYHDPARSLGGWAELAGYSPVHAVNGLHSWRHAGRWDAVRRSLGALHYPVGHRLAWIGAAGDPVLPQVRPGRCMCQGAAHTWRFGERHWRVCRPILGSGRMWHLFLEAIAYRYSWPLEWSEVPDCLAPHGDRPAKRLGDVAANWRREKKFARLYDALSPISAPEALSWLQRAQCGVNDPVRIGEYVRGNDGDPVSVTTEHGETLRVPIPYATVLGRYRLGGRWRYRIRPAFVYERVELDVSAEHVQAAPAPGGRPDAGDSPRPPSANRTT